MIIIILNINVYNLNNPFINVIYTILLIKKKYTVINVNLVIIYHMTKNTVQKNKKRMLVVNK